MFTSMGRPDKAIILRMRVPATKRHLMQTSNFLEQLQWAYCFPKVRMDGHNLYFIRWLKVTRIRGWFLTKGRWLSLLAGCIYHPPCRCLRCNPQTEQEWFHAVATGCAAPSTMLLLKAQSSDWARIIPALYTQAAPSSMLLFKVQSSDWARIIPLHKVACDTTKKELPGLYSSQNITKGGRSSWLVC